MTIAKKITGVMLGTGLAAGLALVASTAEAATIEFTNWESSNTPANLVPTFTVESLAGGNFEVTIDISPASPNGGLLTQVLFDLTAGLLATNITPLAPPVGGPAAWSVSGFATNVAFTPFTVGANAQPSFGYSFGFNYAGPPPNQVPTPVVFQVDNSLLGAALTDWSRVGLRFQTVGEDGELSERTVSSTVVPLPAAAWLMLAGLGSLGLMARRKAKVAA